MVYLFSIFAVLVSIILICFLVPAMIMNACVHGQSESLVIAVLWRLGFNLSHHVHSLSFTISDDDHHHQLLLIPSTKSKPAQG